MLSCSDAHVIVYICVRFGLFVLGCVTWVGAPILGGGHLDAHVIVYIYIDGGASLCDAFFLYDQRFACSNQWFCLFSSMVLPFLMPFLTTWCCLL